MTNADDTPPALAPTTVSELDRLQAAIDGVQDRIVQQQASAADLIVLSAELDTLVAEVRAKLEPPVVPPVEPPVEEPPPGEGPPVEPPPGELPWWLAKGGPSLSGRSFRSGTFAVMGPALKRWAEYMGSPPEISGGNCKTYGPDGRADTWDKVQRQMDVHDHPQTKDCALGLNGLSKTRSYLVAMFTTLPMNAPLEELIEAAKGNRKDQHKRMGERLRRNLDKVDRNHELTVARCNWEQNKKTAFAIGSGTFPNFLLAGGSVAMYNDHMGHFARAFWEGYGYEVPIALSPAYEDGPNVPHVDYAEWLKAGIYALCCGSYHPNAERTRTQDEAWRMVFGLKTGNYTPGLIVECAKKHDLPVAFLESSCPPEAESCRPNLANAAFAWTQFGKLCNRPDTNLAFMCSLGEGMVAEGKQKALGEPINTQWAQMVREHRKWFGKKLAA